MSNIYQPLNRNLISKDILYVNYDQNMERNLSLILKQSYIFGFLFLGVGAIIYIITLLKILVSGGNILVDALELVVCQGHLADGE